MDMVLQKTPQVVAGKHPLGVFALAIVMIVAGVTFAAAGVSFFLLGTGIVNHSQVRELSTVIAGLGAAAGIIFLLFGILHVLLAIGLLQRREAARILTILLFGLSLAGATIGAAITLVRLNFFALGWDLLVLVADLFVIRYLACHRTKQYFEGQPFRNGKPIRAR